MAFHWAESVYTASFTPREYQVELLDSARERNIIICLSKNSSRDFIGLKIIQELSNELRCISETIKSIYLVNKSRIEHVAALVSYLTDLRVGSVKSPSDWDTISINIQVLVTTVSEFLNALSCNFLEFKDINLMIVENCHNVVMHDKDLKQLMEFIQREQITSNTRPRIVGVTGPLYSTGCFGGVLAATLQNIEKALNCKVETASDIVSALRYCTQPMQLLIECNEPERDDLDQELRRQVDIVREWLKDHRFAPNEIYDEEYFDELNAMSDPKDEPYRILDEFIAVLDEFGPWCADRAAYNCLVYIQKQKLKTPYERHYLLLSIVETLLVKIRAIFDYELRDYTEVERIIKFSTPKVLKLMSLIRMFKPETNPDNAYNSATQLQIIKSCNFKALNEALAKKCDEINSGNEEHESIVSSMKTLILNNADDHKAQTTNFSTTKITKENEDGDTGSLKDSGFESSLNSSVTIDRSSSSDTVNCSPKRNQTKRFEMHNTRRQRFVKRTTNTVFRGGTRAANGHFQALDPDALCGIILVKKKYAAKILFALLCELSRHDEDFSFLNVQFTVEKSADPILESREADVESRMQEDVLRRFRMHDCNLLIGTAVLEHGIDIPRCNLVLHWDEPETFSSFAHCKGRARSPGALHAILVTSGATGEAVTRLAEFREIEKMLLSKCHNREPPASDEQYADLFTGCVKTYKPQSDVENAPSVNLLNAVALVNRYCAKLPSDTFTRLTPLWRLYELERNGKTLYQCIVRLPINSPVKRDIIGCPVPSRILARRMAALQTCIALHKSGELDDNLQPLGKECLKVQEELHLLDFLDEEIMSRDPMEPRPGTTKRRQYYFKKIAEALCDCRPLSEEPCHFYEICMRLTCPLPEEHNTRGRQIYDPEDSPHGFGLLTRKFIPKVGSFPIFTRSGEVSVSLNLVKNSIVISEERMKMIYTFINYTFTKVLKLQKLFMLFDPTIANYSYFVVPTIKDENNVILVDWNFLQTIYLEETSKITHPIVSNIVNDEVKITDVTSPTENGNSSSVYKFESELYRDAVVMPWYRNQDTPQYFYVAEICKDLNPLSPFPGSNFKCFEHYYNMKYHIKVKNLAQPLLDVDHTSGRLNFLTPRYVNRKGVALPTSSEETKRAKREDLGNKQILIPELCTVHPFPGALWRAAVCLPCVLYRLNGLLVADQIRSTVALDIGLGTRTLRDDLDWPKLDFGWSLAEVYSKTRAAKTNNANEKTKAICNESKNPAPSNSNDEENSSPKHNKDDGKTGTEEPLQNGFLKDEVSAQKDESVLEIGLWTNDMAEYDNKDMNFVSCKMEGVRYGSPTSWDVHNKNEYNNSLETYSGSDSDDSFGNYSSDDESEESVQEKGGLHIEFQSDTIAEAIESDASKQRTPLCITQNNNTIDLEWNIGKMDPEEESSYVQKYTVSIEEIKQDIIQNGVLIKHDQEIPCRQIPSKIHAQHSKNPNRELIRELIPYQEQKLLNSELTIEGIERSNKAYIEKYGEDKRILQNAADYFEGMKPSTIPETDLDRRRNIVEVSDPDEKFSFDHQPDLADHPGPSPSLILQALTMSNANDGINLERLETIGDSFLKYAITTYLYCTYDMIHEGKLSHLRSLQVSNLHLYRLGFKKNLGESMIATKFEPHDNWLPPCFHVPKDLEEALLDANIPASLWDMVNIPLILSLPRDELIKQVRSRAVELGLLIENEVEEDPDADADDDDESPPGVTETRRVLTEADSAPCTIPYNIITQHSIPDKSIADCVEALIGAYLIECGPRGALLFMSWLGIKVLPMYQDSCTEQQARESLKEENNRPTGHMRPVQKDGQWIQEYYGGLAVPPSPLLREVECPEACLDSLLIGYDALEEHLGYRFRDRAYLLQAMTHASYSPNRLTDCYQRLEFLGDAVLDYLITRHLYDSPMKHSPGALTDLRSALVNNIIFASLAVRHGFHRYFLHQSPGLHDVIARFVAVQESNGHAITEEYYLLEEDECEAMEDVEIPKALGDLFESVAGAIYLDSGMSLDAVWRVYYAMMSAELTQFGNSVPKSPIRELLEMEPETAKFGKPEKLADGRRVRVTVEVFGKGTFKGIGRNYRIAKCTAAKCALKKLKGRGKH